MLRTSYRSLANSGTENEASDNDSGDILSLMVLQVSHIEEGSFLNRSHPVRDRLRPIQFFRYLFHGTPGAGKTSLGGLHLRMSGD